jgi:hypothetical protein
LSLNMILHLSINIKYTIKITLPHIYANILPKNRNALSALITDFYL